MKGDSAGIEPGRPILRVFPHSTYDSRNGEGPCADGALRKGSAGVRLPHKLIHTFTPPCALVTSSPSSEPPPFLNTISSIPFHYLPTPGATRKPSRLHSLAKQPAIPSPTASSTSKQTTLPAIHVGSRTAPLQQTAPRPIVRAALYHGHR
jgi:hypothetical protein